MSPIHSTDHLVFERLQELQREGDQRRRLAHSPKPHPSHLQHLIGRLGTFFVALGTKLQQVERRGEPAV